MIPMPFAEDRMRRFVEGIDRGQGTLFPECLEDWIDADNPVRVIDAFVEKLDLSGLGFDGVAPEATGRPSYHAAFLLKLYIYGYHNRVQSSRRLEREAGPGVWLCEYPGLSFQRSPVCACSLVSSLLLSGATMSQQSSLTQSVHSVRQVLTAYTSDHDRMRASALSKRAPRRMPSCFIRSSGCPVAASQRRIS